MSGRVSVCVDWGSTNFRAWRFEGVRAVESRQSPDGGIRDMAQGDFEPALFDRLGDWIVGADRVLLAGMITSRNGWVESPYLECPAAVEGLLGRAERRAVRGVECVFLPGLCQRTPAPDVMRGEELLILGSMGGGAEETIVLPGTHSKWARVTDGVVRGFGTWMTGELYDLVLRRSLAGRLAQEGPPDDAAFAAGLAAAKAGRPLGALFAARSGVLLGATPATGVADYLSGVLIGAEISEACAGGFGGSALTLVGAPALVERYRMALARFGEGPTRIVDAAAERGFAAVLASDEK
ncbi:2-dehydro-3-deoxygalactonokinase [Rubrimonas sp.]|uniref:2-dehydro-3-deoxygalactonokinase n=1 Tax=Rubrimonas sp. TaxID=2036015 RepID=UPI002FDD33A4